MSTTAEQLLNAALALPEDDRLQLAEALIVSLQPGDQPPFDDSWREVVKRRSAELRSGQVSPIPWDEVKRQAREKAGG
ncbi:MAG: addiction module protein [Isosphaeraceae bacterium]